MLALPERALPDLPQPQPAGPLRSFAQVPTQLMQELTRLRSAELPANAAGVPGRLDPTPVPAPSEAIGPRAGVGAADLAANETRSGEIRSDTVGRLLQDR